jgi:hypothetical protein
MPSVWMVDVISPLHSSTCFLAKKKRKVALSPDYDTYALTIVFGFAPLKLSYDVG